MNDVIFNPTQLIGTLFTPSSRSIVSIHSIRIDCNLNTADLMIVLRLFQTIKCFVINPHTDPVRLLEFMKVMEEHDMLQRVEEIRIFDYGEVEDASELLFMLLRSRRKTLNTLTSLTIGTFMNCSFTFETMAKSIHSGCMPCLRVLKLHDVIMNASTKTSIRSITREASGIKAIHLTNVITKNDLHDRTCRETVDTIDYFTESFPRKGICITFYDENGIGTHLLLPNGKFHKVLLTRNFWINQIKEVNSSIQNNLNSDAFEQGWNIASLTAYLWKCYDGEKKRFDTCANCLIWAYNCEDRLSKHRKYPMGGEIFTKIKP